MLQSFHITLASIPQVDDFLAWINFFSYRDITSLYRAAPTNQGTVSLTIQEEHWLSATHDTNEWGDWMMIHHNKLIVSNHIKHPLHAWFFSHITHSFARAQGCRHFHYMKIPTFIVHRANRYTPDIYLEETYGEIADKLALLHPELLSIDYPKEPLQGIGDGFGAWLATQQISLKPYNTALMLCSDHHVDRHQFQSVVAELSPSQRQLLMIHAIRMKNITAISCLKEQCKINLTELRLRLSSFPEIQHAVCFQKKQMVAWTEEQKLTYIEQLVAQLDSSNTAIVNI